MLTETHVDFMYLCGFSLLGNCSWVHLKRKSKLAHIKMRTLVQKCGASFHSFCIWGTCPLWLFLRTEAGQLGSNKLWGKRSLCVSKSGAPRLPMRFTLRGPCFTEFTTPVVLAGFVSNLCASVLWSSDGCLARANIVMSLPTFFRMVAS